MVMVKEKHQFEPGIYTDIGNIDYHRSAGISASGLKLISKTPYHFYSRYLTGMPHVQTDAMMIGSAAHTKILEPDKFDDEYAIYSGTMRRGKGWEKFKDESEGKNILLRKDYDAIAGMRDAVFGNRAASFLLKSGVVESSHFWIDQSTGVLCKCRPDYLREDVVIDLKTTEDASPGGFSRSVANYSYHNQAAYYLDGVEQTSGTTIGQFIFICVERKPPHLVAIYTLSPQDVELGRAKNRQALQVYADCLQRGQWPGYPEKIEVISLPAWAYNK
jgi:hypothetical protein